MRVRADKENNSLNVSPSVVGLNGIAGKARKDTSQKVLFINGIVTFQNKFQIMMSAIAAGFNALVSGISDLFKAVKDTKSMPAIKMKSKDSGAEDKNEIEEHIHRQLRAYDIMIGSGGKAKLHFGEPEPPGMTGIGGGDKKSNDINVQPFVKAFQNRLYLPNVTTEYLTKQIEEQIIKNIGLTSEERATIKAPQNPQNPPQKSDKNGGNKVT